MAIPLQSRASDLALRMAGLTLLPVGVLVIRTLYRLIQASPVHDSTPIEMGLAALGFIALSLGSLLLALGAHIFDQVEISARWAPRSAPVRERSNHSYAVRTDADPSDIDSLARFAAESAR